MANSAKPLRSRTCGRLYLYDTLLKRLAQDFQDVSCALGQLVQEEHAVVRQRHLPGPRHLPTTDQANVREGVIGGATGARGDQGGAGAGAGAMRWMGVVSRASGRVMAGRVVVRQRAPLVAGGVLPGCGPQG
jgi:hypothetical protein